MDGTGTIAVADDPVPELKPGSVLVEVKSCLVSPGTELGGVAARRENPDPDRPARPFGYGNAGVVLAAGEGCEGIEPGQRLACMGAGYALHATHVVVPRNLTVPLPEELSFDEAAFAHLAATGLWAVRRARVEFGHNAAIFGLGLVGQIAAQVARACGAHVMVVDRLPLRLEIAEKCGADLAFNFETGGDIEAVAREFSRGHGFDVAILAFGGTLTAALDSARRIMKLAPDGHHYGRISIVGGGTFEAQFPQSFGNVDVCASSRPGPGYHDEPWEFGRDYPPVFVQWSTRRNMEECLLFAARKRLDFGSLVTQRVALEEAPAACDELVAHPERAMGVILNP
jgi:threonine dehydrogenase-like Zn-dependent dehydrogenase